MTANEVKIAAKHHGPSVIMLLLGAAIVAFGWTNPDQSADLVNKIVQFVGYIIAGAGGISTLRQGVKQEVEKVSPPSPELASNVASEVKGEMAADMRLVQSTLLRIHNDLDEKHAENRAAQHTIIQRLDEEHVANQRQHDEHRERFGKLEGAVQEIHRKLDVAAQVAPGKTS